MERLTDEEKVEFAKQIINANNPEYVDDNYFQLVKLGHTEDIEEKHNMSIDEMDAYITEHKKIEQELGIDLITLFKALKQENSIYVKDENEVVKFDEFISENRYCNRYQLLVIDTGIMYLTLKNYGKTWALTKEELEKHK